MNKRFNLEDLGLPANLFEGVFEMEEMDQAPVTMFEAQEESQEVNGSDVPIQATQVQEQPAAEGEKSFNTVEASQLYWDCKPDNYYVVIEFSNVVGDAAAALKAGDLNLCSRALAFAEQIADQIRMQEAMTGDTDDFDSAVERIMHVKQGLLGAQQQLQQQAQQQQAQQVQPVAQPVPVQQPVQQQALVPAPVIKHQAAPWKRTAEHIPFVGGVFMAMPDQNTFYDSALNAVFGPEFKKYKGIVSLVLAAAASAGVYYYFIKPRRDKKKQTLKNRRNPFMTNRNKKASKPVFDDFEDEADEEWDDE